MRHKRIFGASFLLLGAGLLVGGSQTAQAACKPLLAAAAFDNQPLDEPKANQLAHRARALIDRVADLARDDHDHDRH